MPPVDNGPYGVTAKRRESFCSVDLAEGNIQLSALTSTHASPYSATIETRARWGVTPLEPTSLNVLLQNWVGPLQNLVSFATLSPNRVDDISVGEAADAPYARVHLELRGDWLSAPAASYLLDAKLLLTPAMMRDQGAEIIAGWMKLAAQMPTRDSPLAGSRIPNSACIGVLRQLGRPGGRGAAHSSVEPAITPAARACRSSPGVRTVDQRPRPPQLG